MNFLYPAILFGLFAVSLPILIHLFNLTKVNKIEFSTLMFLKELQKSKVKKIKLKQIILLIIRILIIALIVFAFASPYIKNSIVGMETRKCIIIFLDNSFSMSISDEKGEYFSRVKAVTEEIAGSSKNIDKVIIIPSSNQYKTRKNIHFNDFKGLNDSLNKLKFSYSKFSFSDLYNALIEIMNTEKFPVYEVFLLSDMQSVNLNGSNIQSTNYSQMNISNVFFHIVNFGKRIPNNISVDKIEPISKLFSVNREIKFKVTIRNHNNYNVFNKKLLISIENEVISDKIFDISAMERKEIELTVKTEKSGNIHCFVELQQDNKSEDELIQDNKIFFDLSIKYNFNIGIIAARQDYAKYFILALKTSDKLINKSGKNQYLYEFTSLGDNINKYDELFILDKKSFTIDEVNNLKVFLDSGKGVFVFPNGNTDINNYNETLLKDIDVFRVNNIDEFNNITTIAQNPNSESPILQGIFYGKESSLEANNVEFKIKKYFTFLLNDNTSSVVKISNNRDYIIESKLNKGKLLFSAVSSNTEMSDFPLSSIYLPVILNSVNYLGNDELFKIKSDNDYERRDTLESIPNKANETEVLKYFENYGLKNIDYVSDSELKFPLITNFAQKELWKPILLLSILLMVIEIIYTKRIKRNK